MGDEEEALLTVVEQICEAAPKFLRKETKYFEGEIVWFFGLFDYLIRGSLMTIAFRSHKEQGMEVFHCDVFCSGNEGGQ